jgi:hypothetical protein
MIITRLAGGLGNQMFQYAAARGLQRDLSEKIILDTRLLQKLESDIEKIIQRPYALNVFPNLQAIEITKNFRRLLSNTNFVSKIWLKHFNVITANVEQIGMVPIDVPFVSSKNIYLSGNFQSEIYFKKRRVELLEDFKFPKLDGRNELIKTKILNSSNSVAIHFRRGDYLSTLNKKVYTSVNLQYYQQAISTLKSKSNLKKLDIFVFTDDIDWVSKNIMNSSLNLVFVEGNKNEESWKDMYLMTCCRHHIIANSSFSWWGAWLSKNNGVKIAPRYWFHPNTVSYDINHIIPSSWMLIDYKL